MGGTYDVATTSHNTIRDTCVYIIKYKMRCLLLLEFRMCILLMLFILNIKIHDYYSRCLIIIYICMQIIFSIAENQIISRKIGNVINIRLSKMTKNDIIVATGWCRDAYGYRRS